MTSLSVIKTKLTSKRHSFHSMSTLALEIVLFLFRTKDNDVECLLKREFLRVTIEHDLGSILNHQIQYANRIAESDSIIFEEICKLLSLLEEIEALKYLGFTCPKEEIASLKKNVQGLITKKKKLARSIAKTYINEWNQGLWWNVFLEVTY